VGALGHGDKTPHFVPTKVKGLEGIRVKQIAAGIYHSMVLTDNGDIYTWGRGLYGTLGNGSNQYSLEPILNEEFAGLKKEDPENNTIHMID